MKKRGAVEGQGRNDGRDSGGQARLISVYFEPEVEDPAKAEAEEKRQPPKPVAQDHPEQAAGEEGEVEESGKAALSHRVGKIDCQGRAAGINKARYKPEGEHPLLLGGVSHLIKKSFQRKGNYWLAAASEALGPVLRAWAETRAGAPSAPESWRKGLLLGAGHIGDVLYRTGSLPDLARAFPQCRWFFAAPWPAREVLGGNPFLAGVVPLRDELSRLPWRELVDLIRAEEPDVVIGYDGGAIGGICWPLARRAFRTVSAFLIRDSPVF